MAEKKLDFGKFREARILEPDDLSLLRFIFKKYLKDKTMMKKLMDESEKDDQSDMVYMLAESLKLAEKGRGLDEELKIFISRNNILNNVMRWIGLASKEKLVEEYNLQASILGIKGDFKNNHEDFSGKTTLGPVVKNKSAGKN
jgi:hypothetical protein